MSADGFVRLEGGQLDGGFVCGACGASTTFSLRAGEPIPDCGGCGRSVVSPMFAEEFTGTAVVVALEP
jgi:hypothetical protein